MFFRKALPPGADAQDVDEGRMPFLAHLGELRQRIIVSVIALGLGFIATFSFSERIITWLAQPIEPVKLVFLEPTEPFWVNMKVALIAGAFLVLPVLLYQVWAFIAPGLLPHERKFALPFVILSTLMFFVGATFALKVIIPFAVKFLVSYKTAEPRADALGEPVRRLRPEVHPRLRPRLRAAARAHPRHPARAGDARVPLEESEVRDPALLRGGGHPDADSRRLQPAPDGRAALPPLRGRHRRPPGCSAAGRSPRRPDPDALRRARRPARGPGGHPGRRVHDRDAHPGGGAARRPPRQGRGRPGPDRHRQDGGVPDRDLHPAPPSPAGRTPRGVAARPDHRAHAGARRPDRCGRAAARPLHGSPHGARLRRRGLHQAAGVARRARSTS